MRWDCPHCGTALAVSDEKLSAAWTFSRCYSCSGFALVRRSEVNLIKVDRAPHGENVLLPESTETPMLSNQAIHNLTQRHSTLRSASQQSPYDTRPQIRPATRRAPSAPAVKLSTPKITPPAFSAPPSVQSAIEKLNSSQTLRRLETQLLQTSAPSNPRGAMLLPEPLPYEPERPWYYRFLPVLIACTGIGTMSSGIFVYLKAKTLTAPTQAPAQMAVRPPTQDSISTRAMAPERTKVNAPPPEKGAAALVLKPGNTEVPVYAAPDRSSNKVGTAKPDMPYVVNEIRTGWFQILVKDSIQSRTAWIPAEQTEVITAGDVSAELD